MTKEKFRIALTKAVAGDNEALADIVELYMPLINYYSYVDSKLDEDLRQAILLHLLEKISKFQISEKNFHRTIRFPHFQVFLLYERHFPMPWTLTTSQSDPVHIPAGERLSTSQVSWSMSTYGTVAPPQRDDPE